MSYTTYTIKLKTTIDSTDNILQITSEKSLENAKIKMDNNQLSIINDVSWYCDLCCKRFKSKEDLLKDIDKHFRFEICNECNYHFLTPMHDSNKKCYNSHKFITKHYKNNELHCPHCGFVTIIEKYFKKHIQKHSNNPNNIQIKCEPIENKNTNSSHSIHSFNGNHCQICLQTFTNTHKAMLDFDKHLKNICNICNIAYGANIDNNKQKHYSCYKKHRFVLDKLKTFTKFKCKHCPFITVIENNLSYHEAIHSKSTLFNSNKNNKIVSNFITNTHIKKKKKGFFNKNKYKKKYILIECKVCFHKHQTESLALSDFDYHSRQLCKICNIEFGAKVSHTQYNSKCYQKHKFIFDKLKNFTKFNCKYCPYVTIFEKLFSKHELQHKPSDTIIISDDEEYNNSFQNMHQISEELSSVFIEYKCHDCNKIFKNPQALGGHRSRSNCKTKINIETYKCNHCNKTFNNPKALGGHTARLHSKKYSKKPCKIKELIDSDSDSDSDNDSQSEDEQHKPSSDIIIISDDEQCIKPSQNIQQTSDEFLEYKCHDCDRIFKNHQALGGHRSRSNCKQNIVMRKIDIEENELNIKKKIYKCNDCNKTFNNPQALGGHRARSHCNKHSKKRCKIQKTIITSDESSNGSDSDSDCDSDSESEDEQMEINNFKPFEETDYILSNFCDYGSRMTRSQKHALSEILNEGNESVRNEKYKIKNKKPKKYIYDSDTDTSSDSDISDDLLNEIKYKNKNKNKKKLKLKSKCKEIDIPTIPANMPQIPLMFKNKTSLQISNKQANEVINKICKKQPMERISKRKLNIKLSQSKTKVSNSELRIPKYTSMSLQSRRKDITKKRKLPEPLPLPFSVRNKNNGHRQPPNKKRKFV